MAKNVTTDDLQKALTDLATSMGLSVKEYVKSLGYSTVDELGTAITGVQSQIDAITEISDNGTESLAEKIKAINSVVEDSDGHIQNILALVQANKQLVTDEETRASSVEADLQSQLTANTNKVASNETAIANSAKSIADNKTAQDAVNAAVDGRVAGAETTIATLTGDETVDGSIAKIVKSEADRAKAQEVVNTKAVSDEVTRATVKEADLQSQLDNITGGATGSISELSGRVQSIESELEDTTDKKGNLVKGSKSRIVDLEVSVANEVTTRAAAVEQTLTEAKGYCDTMILKASLLDIQGIGNQFRSALGLASKNGSKNDSKDDNSDGAVV